MPVVLEWSVKEMTDNVALAGFAVVACNSLMGAVRLI